MKWLFGILFICLLLEATSQDDDDTNSSNFPTNDFMNFFNDLWKKLGIEKTFSKLGKYISKSIREAKSYTAYEFEKDFEKLKGHPSFWNFIEFISKTTGPGIVNVCVKIINFFSQIQRFLLRFLKNKCDLHVGRDAPFHPWNIMKDEDKTQLSFLVFVYALAISLIVIKLLSWWNFSVYLAFGFLAYYLGGPNLVFKLLLTLSAFIWFVIDVIIRNPLQIAIVIIVLYLLSVAKTLLTSDQQTTSSVRRFEGKNIPGREEFDTLAERLEIMERKTNLMHSKIDTLTRNYETIVSDNEE